MRNLFEIVRAVKMDGVLLAGGLASRLGPITKVTNKHLLPIYDKPLIFYGIELLRDLGCERIIIVLGGNSVGDIVNLVRDGSQFGVEVIYRFQDQPNGISDAIHLTRDIVTRSGSFKFLVLLGDNVFADTQSLKKAVASWHKSILEDTTLSYPVAIFLHSSDHPHDYGQPILIDEGTRVQKFVEKDTAVDHNLIVTGLYGLNYDTFNIIDYQDFSARGELEITDTLTAHLPNVIAYSYDGFWSDCGTPEGLIEASKYMKDKDRNEDTSKR
jgi:glucose-1-phosphate thymidylyltransferase